MNYKKKPLSILLRANQTVFTVASAAIYWSDTNAVAVRDALRYYAKRGALIRVRTGLYAKDKNYNRLELATKILVPAYVSFETALQRESMIFQVSNEITVASYAARTLTVGQQRFVFRRIREEILTNPLGIIHERGASIASAERAFLDMLYLHKNYYFDNLRRLDWSRVMDLLPIYQNKRLERVVAEQKKHYELQRDAA